MKLYLVLINYDKIMEREAFQANHELIYPDGIGSFPKQIHDSSLYVMYAFSESKKLAESFVNSRNSSLFLIRKMKVSPSERTEFISHFTDFLLKESSFDFFNKSIDYVTTVFEGESYYSEFDMIDDVMDELDGVGYDLLMKVIPGFKDKYVKMLSNTNVMQILRYLSSVSIGEPAYLTPDFISFMLEVYDFTYM